MSRTRRGEKLVDKLFRSPRGNAKARAEGCRPNAVPPNPWEDLPPSAENHAPWEAAIRMKRQHRTMEQAIAKLKSKWRLPRKTAERLVKQAYSHELP